MAPALTPGDRLLVRKLKRPSKRLVGRIVVALDPRNEATLVIKRLVSIDGDSFELLGDNPDASTDSRTIGRFPNALLAGEVVYRYHPLGSAGRVR